MSPASTSPSSAACRNPPSRWSSPGRPRGASPRAPRRRSARRPRSSATGPTPPRGRSRRGAARTVVLVVPDVTNPFFGGLLRGAQTAARAAGYAVALIDTDNDRDWGAASAEALHAGPADGLLLLEIDPPRAGGLRARRDDRVRGARPSRRSASTPAAAPRPRSATCSSWATSASGTSPRSTTGRRSGRASARSTGWSAPARRASAPTFTLDGAQAADARAAARRPRRPPRCSATTT